MKNRDFGIWLSRTIRWAMTLGFVWIAYHYPDLWYLYIFAATALVTSFVEPKRCLDNQES